MPIIDDQFRTQISLLTATNPGLLTCVEFLRERLETSSRPSEADVLATLKDGFAMVDTKVISEAVSLSNSVVGSVTVLSPSERSLSLTVIGFRHSESGLEVSVQFAPLHLDVHTLEQLPPTDEGMPTLATACQFAPLLLFRVGQKYLEDPLEQPVFIPTAAGLLSCKVTVEQFRDSNDSSSTMMPFYVVPHPTDRHRYALQRIYIIGHTNLATMSPPQHALHRQLLEFRQFANGVIQPYAAAAVIPEEWRDATIARFYQDSRIATMVAKLDRIITGRTWRMLASTKTPYIH